MNTNVGDIIIENPSTFCKDTEEFIRLANEYKSNLTKLYAEVDNLKNYWEGGLANTHIGKIKQYENDFNTLSTKLIEYSEHLNTIAEGYQKLENI